MEIALILTREVLVMGLIICIGVYTRKKNIFTPELASKLADFLVSIIMPIMVINTFQRDKDPALVPGFWATAVMTAVMYAVSIVISMLAFRKKDASVDHKIARMAVTFPNCGFMGIPLLLAATGEDSVLYCAAMIGVLQIFMWCWGIPMLEEKKPSLKKVLINPGIISVIVGLVTFLLEIRLPEVALSFVRQLSSLNTPLSLLMIGIFLADVKLRDTFRSPMVYKAVALRNIVIPMVSIFLLYAVNLTAYFGKTFSLSFVILIACSTAASTMLLPLKSGIDGSLASQMIAASSVFSIITLPLVAFVAEKVL